MLSRRTIRIKAMQLIYAMGRDEAFTFTHALSQFNVNARRTHEIYLLCLLYWTEVARQSIRDLNTRGSKLLPSQEDKNFNAKLFENEVVQAVAGNQDFAKAVGKYKLLGRIDPESLRHLYSEFAKNEKYLPYVLNDKTTTEDHNAMGQELMRFLLADEVFLDLIDGFSSSWEDDESLVVGAFKKTIKALPATNELYLDFNEEDLATREFGERLLSLTLKKQDELIEEIKPMLRNWEADRVATLDLIMLEMALCELMHFETIPTKVTLNEYVEISKLYSTDKSKDFINGILDQLMRKLIADGRIVKTGRGLMT